MDSSSRIALPSYICLLPQIKLIKISPQIIHRLIHLAPSIKYRWITQVIINSPIQINHLSPVKDSNLTVTPQTHRQMLIVLTTTSQPLVIDLQVLLHTHIQDRQAHDFRQVVILKIASQHITILLILKRLRPDNNINIVKTKINHPQNYHHDHI